MDVNYTEIKDGLGSARRKRIKAWLPVVLAGCCLMMLCACSAIAFKPHSAHIQIEGLNRQIGEFVIALDDYSDRDFDIPLNDHYALRLDFKWLWSQDTPTASALYIQEAFDDSYGPPLSPWLTCKYRF